MSVINWIDQRTGLVSQIDGFLTEDVPGGASYWYVFGSATIFFMILQFVTGIFLTFFYAPSAATAWESTRYIYTQVPFGEFVLSLHFWGATGMIALMFMHLLQVLLWGAYKAPREIMWVVGIIMLVVTLVLGLTGYLLPWDMNAYFASKVAITIASSVPFVGNAVQQFLAGGPSMGTLTIGRFFGLHVWLMPAILALLAVLHLVIFRHNGSAGPPSDSENKRLPQGRFWPNQMFMDATASFAVFTIIVLLSIFAPAPLDTKADPNQNFNPYPAWYFLALYGLLRASGQVPAFMLSISNLLATVVIPGVIVLFLIVFPWLDRNPSRRLSRRPWVLGVTALAVIVSVGLTLYSQFAVQAEQAAAGSVPFWGLSPAVAHTEAPAIGGLQVAAAKAHAAQLFSTNCASCHGATGMGQPGVFPPLAGNAYETGDPNAVIHTVLYGRHEKITVNGKTYDAQMPPWKGSLSDADLAAVISYVRSSWGNNAGPVTEAQVAKLAKLAK
ncbi:MAG: cytochrome b N-terminal domain-containing protein [Vulcanimicrobiaceae bacterium]